MEFSNFSVFVFDIIIDLNKKNRVETIDCLF